MKSTKANKQARSTQNGALVTTNKQISRQKKNRRGNPKGPMNCCIHLSPCAMDYAAVKLRPFESSKTRMPCIPDALDIPSMKFSTLVRGELHMGTLGTGFVGYAPFTLASDEQFWACSAANWAATSYPSAATGTGISAGNNTPYPWIANDARCVRVVASALRIRYTGTELTRGGRVILAQCVTRSGSFAGITVSDLMSRPETRSFPCSREWRTIGYFPSYNEAQSYTTDSYSGSSVSNYKVICLVTGDVANTFEWEIITYYEAVSESSNAVTGVSKSHTDLIGYGLVKDYLGSLADGVLDSSALQNFVRFAGNAAVGAATTYITGGPTSSVPLLEYLK